jgi:hypothetical protein
MADVGRILAAIFTGGASEIANSMDEQLAAQRAKAQQEETQLEEAAREAAQARALAAKAATAKAGDQTAVQVNTCCTFQISGDYLLETTQGIVWRFDQSKNEFVYVPREKPPLERSLTAILINQTKDTILEKLNELYWRAPDAQKPGLRKAIDAHSQLLDSELKKAGG